MDKIKEIADKLKTDFYDEKDGDEIIIKEIDDDCYYSYVKSNKRGFGSMLIDSKFTYLFFSSGVSLEKALIEFKNGRRS